ncbi:MAG: lipid IV(A) 3-deoxy-D-manno-octulosonic acid transferase [Casimicrobiaceae bacterium]
MARFLYTAMWCLMLPLLPLRLWWRGHKEAGYREHIGERFGRYRPDSAAPTTEIIWIHAVSLGETRAAAPLIERILRERPASTILLTHMTATGRSAGHAFAGERVVQAWLPYDVPFAARAFLARFHPRVGLLIETELWPNLMAACRAMQVPVFLVNARLSQRSERGYSLFASLAAPMFAALSGVAAQTSGDAARLAQLGARDVIVTGNLKFDVALPAQARRDGAELRRRLGIDRPVWIAASTRDGEEALLLDALERLPLPGMVVTVIVPRHPQRFAAVAELLRVRGLSFIRRSDDLPIPSDRAFVLGDTLSELFTYYAAADVSFVGGSLVPAGGQNLIEPLAVGLPTLIGPHTFNFADATTLAIEAGAALRVPDSDSLVTEVAALLANAERRQAMREAALAFHAAHQGASDRTWRWLAPKL